MRITTLCYPVINGQVLLAMKKRGFGVGKWNGPGGKVQGEETAEQACCREFLEETGSTIKKLEDRGTILFQWPHKPDWDQECHIYVATELEGQAQETEEMLPKWFDLQSIPYSEMWEDDPHWLPGVLNGGNVKMRFVFDENNKIVEFGELK